MSLNPIEVHVDNIKCGGCEKSIVKGLSEIKGVSDIVIDRDQQIVHVRAEAALRDAVVAKLNAMGYPEQGRLQGLQAGLANAKSFVSCMMGRVSS